MDETPISGKDFMVFMNQFKNTIENTMLKVESSINEKLDKKIAVLDDGFASLQKQVEVNEKKTDKISEILTGRMTRMEQDLKRMQFRKMKSDTLGRRENVEDEIETREKNVEEEETPEDWTQCADTPASRNREIPRTKQTSPPKIVRCRSWAEEVEQSTDIITEQDKQQWMERRRNPPCWTDEVRVTCRAFYSHSNHWEGYYILSSKDDTKE